MKLIKKTLALIAICLTGTSELPADTDASTGISQARLGEFISRLDELREDKQIPGLAFAIVKDGQILTTGGLGYAEREGGRLATADPPVNIASVTNPLSAVVAMRLVEAGQLDLDRPMAEYSQWQDFCKRFSKVPSIFARNLNCSYENHTLRHLLSHSGEGKPGQTFSYNPVAYSWGSRPMMAVTGQSFSMLMNQYVLQPAGMTQSARMYRDLPLSEAVANRFAVPYRLDEAGQVIRAPRPPAQGDGAGGGVVATVLDLAKFDIAYDAGNLVSAESRQQMMAPTRLSNGEPSPYGLGWFVQNYQGEKLVWHSGWWDHAWSALYLKVPEHNISFIALANSEGIWWHNSLTGAEVDKSEFARAFLHTFVL